jgi:hypothetical protein
MLPSVELVARNMDGLRSLDSYQPGLGTNTVRWMQYLSAEALDVLPSGPSPEILREQTRLCEALGTIRASVTAVDRFAAMRRSSASSSGRATAS